MIGYTGWAIPEGNVVEVADASGRVIWSAVPPVLNVLYLRPSADISVNHILYPADSTAAYLLINEEVPDDASTYIKCEFTAGDTSTYRNSSSFRFSCANLPQKYKIKNARLVVRHGTTAGAMASLTAYHVSATISVNGIESNEMSVLTIHPSDADTTFAYYRTYYADITDILVNNSLSSDFAVTLTQVCSDCTVYETTGDNTGTKTYDTATRVITTAWIEVEYV